MEPNKLSLNSLRECAARLMASAVLSSFRGVELVSGGASDVGFFYDFVFPKPVDQLILPIIEERMRDLVTRDEPILQSEMLRSNLAGYFTHHHHPQRAKVLLEGEGPLVEVIQWGDFRDACPTPYPESLGALAANKILEIEDRGGGIVRITGVVDRDKSLLKDFIKSLKEAEKFDPLTYLKSVGWLSPTKEGWIWQGEGEAFQNQLIQLWHELMVAEGFHILSVRRQNAPVTFYNEHIQFFKSVDKIPLKVAEIGIISYLQSAPNLFHPEVYLGDEFRIFSQKQEIFEHLISSLQFILQWIKMFDIEGFWRLGDGGQQTQKKSDGPKSNLRKMGFQGLQKACEAYQLTPKTEAETGIDASREGRLFLEYCVFDVLKREWPIARLGLNIAASEGELVVIEGGLVPCFERLVALIAEKRHLKAIKVKTIES